MRALVQLLGDGIYTYALSPEMECFLCVNVKLFSPNENQNQNG